MYADKLMKIKFEFTGSSIDAVLDRLPTAHVVECNNDIFIIEAEVYGKGIMMWLLSQGKNVKVIYPLELVEEIVIEISKLQQLYK